MPVLACSRMMVANFGEKAPRLTAVDLKNGSAAWEKALPAGGSVRALLPIVDGEDIIVFNQGIERLSCIDGHRVFLQSDLAFDENSPPPQLEDDNVLTIDSANRLISLNAASGKINWTADLPPNVRISNIFPLGKKIYLRGMSDNGDYLLLSARRNDGALVWTYRGQEQNISNLVEGDGILYGTPTSLVAVYAKSGKQVFSRQVTTTGRAFPVRIRMINGRLIYIGELVVAGYDAKTGALKYSHGMTPICPECHLNGLDAAIPRLKEAANEPAALEGHFGNLSTLATAEMNRYQNLANTYARAASTARSRGDSIGSELASMKSGFAQQNAKLEADMAFAYAVMDLGVTLQRVLEARAIQASIERQELFRSSILRTYRQAESDEYVYRPHMAWADAGDSFTTLSIVHMPSGKRRDTYVSPTYLSYGLWNLVDFEKGLVYHHGIGMNPTNYEWSEARPLYPYGSARTIETFLVAVPVGIPR